MSSTLKSPRHRRLADIVAEQRRAYGLTQYDVATKLGRHQPFVAHIESGQRRIDVVEFLQLAAVIGFDSGAVIQELEKIPDPIKSKKKLRGWA